MRQSPIAKVMAESARALQKEYCATGECTEADISHYITNAHKTGYWALYHSTISVIVGLLNNSQNDRFSNFDLL